MDNVDRIMRGHSNLYQWVMLNHPDLDGMAAQEMVHELLALALDMPHLRERGNNDEAKNGGDREGARVSMSGDDQG